jgi:hypothetical protein
VAYTPRPAANGGSKTSREVTADHRAEFHARQRSAAVHHRFETLRNAGDSRANISGGRIYKYERWTAGFDP